jgi:hypothetical protein
MAAIASIACGTTIDAPKDVIVPETLMTGLTPIFVRISSDIHTSIASVIGFCIDNYAIIM